MKLNIHLHSFMELRKCGVLPARSVTSARHRECPKGKLTHTSKTKTDFTLFLSVGGKVVGQKKLTVFPLLISALRTVRALFALV